MSLINDLSWRYAVQAFDPKSTLPKDAIDGIVEAFRLAPSSFGLQPGKLIVIEDKNLQKELVSVSYNQAKIADASAILVFAYRKNLDASHAISHIENTAKTTGATLESLEPYKNSLLGFINNTPEEVKNVWAKNQVYLAVGVVVAYLSEQHIDACCMEGFVPSEYDRILGLEEENCSAAVVIPIGKRDESDPFGKVPKTRFSTDIVSRRITS